MLYRDFRDLMREQKSLDTLTDREKDLRKDGYRSGWNDRADHDRELIEDAARQSSDYEEFISNIREKFRRTEESILL
jgi:DNA helicase IV